MVKHIQAIFRLLPTNFLRVFDHFVGLALKELVQKFFKVKYLPQTRSEGLSHCLKNY